MAQKTRDGLKLKNVIRALEELAFVYVRRGSNHPYVAFREAYPVPCPIAASTDARKMVVPWVKNVTDYQNANQIYQALRKGEWN
jgi:predicted RNA binding protein YcfA (HicA-like mRNA interferase family)